MTEWSFISVIAVPSLSHCLPSQDFQLHMTGSETRLKTCSKTDWTVPFTSGNISIALILCSHTKIPKQALMRTVVLYIVI